jgi:hypothetical protein
MTVREQLLQEIRQAPEILLDEFLDFVLFAKTRRQVRYQTQPKATKLAYKPIWEIADEITADIPQEVWDKLPTDAAEQIDHYLYGSPKR